MSAKIDKQEKPSGSKMLKKARSFRDDVKGALIKKRPSSSGAPQPLHIHKSSKSKSKLLNRASSMSDKTDGVGTDDIDKLQLEVNNVHRSLQYITAVVDQEKVQIVPNTATVVLETVMDVFTLLNNFFVNKDSTTLQSRNNQVCQCLAKFIQWSDDILLHGDKALNKDAAHQVISSLSDGVKELAQLCINKLEKRNASLPRSPVQHTNSNSLETSKRTSLPDIPLTPREKTILAETCDMGIYDNAPLVMSRSEDSITNNNNIYNDVQDSPPPKPPLPQTGSSLLPNLKKAASVDADSKDIPPPLPTKQRSQSSMIEYMSVSSDQRSPSRSPVSSAQLTPNQSPYNSMIECSPTQDLSFSSDLVTPISQSPYSTSPSSSVGSGLNQSTEDLLGSGSQSRSMSSGGLRFSTEMMKAHSFSSLQIDSHNSEQFNQIAREINKLTLATKTEEPPPIPVKRIRRLQRGQSEYDNVPDVAVHISSSSSRTFQAFTSNSNARISSSSSSSNQSFSGSQIQKSNTISFSQRSSSSETFSSLESLPNPPPLPPKNRHIQDYMRTFGSYTQPSGIEMISRHSINFYEGKWHQYQMDLHPPYPRSNTISVISDLSSDLSASSGPSSPAIPPLPVKKTSYERIGVISTQSSQSDPIAEVPREKAASLVEAPTQITIDAPLVLEPKRSSAPPGPVPDELPASPKPDTADTDSDFAELNLLDDIDVSDQLIRKKDGEDGPEIRGGSVDALIVHATAAGKTEFIFQEAFLTTYRTFISASSLIEKLLYRFHKFQHATESKKRLSRSSFSLLVRVIDELGCNELSEHLLQQMMDLVFELLCQSDLVLAKTLRKMLIDKCEAKRLIQEASAFSSVISTSSSAGLSDLLHVKSQDIAEQMTLLDAELFQKIEIPEVLLWAREQSEELSPNLTTFTEHFNKMSYWCRTQILKQEEAKDREKYLIKFIKIMKHLRKLSNFNSYLAVLSALDSAPVRRLEWQKQNLEALKEFCLLIDSSSSFRVYRQALSETEPPCIPYIGLILQDLTFINIGNQDQLPDGSINFAKRWQQFNILDSMRRFKKCHYEMKKNENIVARFGDFSDFLNEDSLWQISETIKPRGGKRHIPPDT
ncbi:hypothetical protein ScPMuIL_011626 [Solemya velum]